MNTQLSLTEENYLKTIYALSQQEKGKIPNLSIAEMLSINPATVTEMLKKLQDKKLIEYNRIDGASLSATGNKIALKVIRKHRLWETFLVKKLDFSWDEVHEIAEQLEHIQSEKLISELDRFLDFPKYDPHGDPIPDKDGNLPVDTTFPLAESRKPGAFQLIGVANHSPAFLQYLDKIKLEINDTIEVKDIQEFDKSMTVKINQRRQSLMLSNEVTKNLLVSK
ncbi:iron-dependent repressor [Arachidicoccus ginsenosidimutans]|uniref:metal-dependent transcriptional regulator n=1 Tax=Arachidicoccus sp. BS20 TaxID=1850526 RepID=UPI0007F06299|nr:metal-dependent transcriptional regulator [Arachidicoccus sp. BS20]ANI90164.1 iron-dependent repressor [Arachidicoccus sp. BS20]